jgi:hypothetical protein
VYGAYDQGRLDLLPHLEPAWRAQLAHAVGHVGLIGALRRIGGTRRPDLAANEVSIQTTAPLAHDKKED